MISITIKQKLIVLIIIKIIAFSSVLYIGGARLALNSKQLSNIQSMYYPVMNSAEINNVKLTQLSETFGLSVTLGDEDLLIDNRKLLKSINNEFNNQEEHQKNLFNEIENLRELTGIYFDSSYKLASLMINGDISLSEASHLSKVSSEKLKELKTLFNSFSEQRTSDFESLVSEIERSNNKTHKVMRIVGIISFFIILFLFLIISNYIKVSLFNITKKMKDIAEGKGDLTERLSHINKDELYELVHWFNLFISNLQKNVSQAKDNTEQLSDVSTTLVDTSELTKELSYKQYRTVDEVTVLLGDLFTSVKNISSNAFDTSNAANNANKEAKKGELQVQNTIQSVHELTSEVHSALVVIQELNTYTYDASSILDSINSIAEQTNLLALNAAIEAARAGERGSGFAVVADEVRTLALRTKTATQEINTVLELLQNQATKAVNMISNSGKKATLCAEQSKISELSLQTITNEVNQITQRNKIIATLAGEQASTSQHIQVFVDDIHKMSEKTTENTKNIDSVSHEVELITSSLTVLNNKFKVS